MNNSEIQTQKPKLVAYKYKKWVYTSFLIPVTFLILKMADVLELEAQTSKSLFSVLFFIPLMLLAFTAEKIEDERIEKIRMRALGAASLFAFSYVMIRNIMDLLTPSGEPYILSANELILTMLFFYLINKYFLLKKG